MIALLAAGLMAATPSPVDFARVGVHAARIVGTRQVGQGTRDGHVGTIAALDLDVMRFPSERVGIDLGFALAKVAVPYRGNDSNHGRMWGGVDVALLRGAAGSVIVGAGPGFEIGNRMWWTDSVRGYLDAGLRLRWFPARDVAVHANARADVIASGGPAATTFRSELLLGRGLFFFGARYERTQVESGTPRRVYVDHALGLSLSIGVHG